MNYDQWHAKGWPVDVPADDPINGWRLWVIQPDGRLMSSMAEAWRHVRDATQTRLLETVWDGPTMTATCEVCDDPPGEECLLCGVHAFAWLAAMHAEGPVPLGHHAIGYVTGWGRVLPDTTWLFDGVPAWRASHVRVERLLIPAARPDATTDYGIPTRRTRASTVPELLEDADGWLDPEEADHVRIAGPHAAASPHRWRPHPMASKLRIITMLRRVASTKPADEPDPDPDPTTEGQRRFLERLAEQQESEPE